MSHAMKLFFYISLGVALLVACGKKTDPQDKPATKPVEAEPAKPIAAAPKVIPVSSSQKDRDLIQPSSLEKSELSWTAPSGEQITVAAKTHLVGDQFSVDLVVNGNVVETVATQAKKPNEDGWKQYDPIASVAAIPEGVLFVAGRSKNTGKPEEYYDARVLTWDAAAKTLAVARKIQWEHAYDPSKDGPTE
jgi:hypothetical protein